MTDLPLSEQQQTDRAWDLVDSSSKLPPIATAEYRGPSEGVAALVQGASMAVLGYYGGRTFGRMGERARTLQSESLGGRMWETTFKWAGAAILGFLGFHSGSKSVRDGYLQTLELQHAIENIHEQNLALKDELKAQLRGRGKLAHYDESWEAGRRGNLQGNPADLSVSTLAKAPPLPDPAGDTARDPKTMINASDVAHEAMKSSEQGVQV